MTKKIYMPHLSTASHAKPVRTRRAMRRALVELLGDRHYEQVSIRDITTQAGVGYTTFFRHYPAKEALLNDLAADQVQQLASAASSAVQKGDLHAAMLALCHYVDAHRGLWTVLLSGSAAGAIREEFLRMAGEIAAGQDWPESWLPAEAGIILIVSGVVELLAWWLRQEEPLAAERVADILDRSVVTPNVAAVLQEQH